MNSNHAHDRQQAAFQHIFAAKSRNQSSFQSHMFESQFLKNGERQQQTVGTFINYFKRKAKVWIVSRIGRKWISEKMLQTKSATQKMNWVQIKTYSERITQQKHSRIIFNKNNSDELTSLKKRLITLSHFRGLGKKSPNNA